MPAECNVDENQVILAGIEKNGYIFAEKIKNKFEEISNIKGVLCAVKINKKNPINKVKTSLRCEQYSNKSVVLIDDVLHSGTTLIYAVKHFLETPLKQIKTAVLAQPSRVSPSPARERPS